MEWREQWRSRLAIAVAVLALTASLLVWKGLSITTGLIELVTFLFGLGGWIVLGSKDSRDNSAVVENVRARGSAKIRQSGESTTVRRVAAGEVDIDQRQSRR